MIDLSFDELNKKLIKEKENISNEVLGLLVSKGIEIVELYLKKLGRKYGVYLNSENIYEITNQVIDNISKYYRIEKNSNFKSYLFMIAKGKFFNYLRDKLKYKHIFENEIDEGFKEKEVIILDEILEIEKKIVLKNAFFRLNEKCQKSLYYRKVQELSIFEIKKIMNLNLISEGALRKQIAICLKKLRELYNN